ncbi:flagellar hook-length control protein FliK [Alkalilacustris brevis]|uniref:flagellar hook-length control protein FliK n=1 Tax=Alkalilacustris brevis TaxID=2026338 RepID=UPI00138FA954|nr:flagellar hook-length control protein FliK [Alkalilacustris brevis]
MPQPSPDPGRAAALQIAAAAGNLHGGGLEITLSPEELGRVRLTMSGTEGALSITILAERGETLDLLRRNIELLAQELRDMGFSSLSFNFGQGHHGAADDTAPPDHEQGGQPADPVRPAETRHTLAHEAGLDLRL